MTQPPPKPNPSEDAGVIPRIEALSLDNTPASDDTSLDVNTIEPITALNILARGLQGLVDLTGDIPPTPPLSQLIPIPSPTPRTHPRPKTPPSQVPNDDLQSPTIAAAGIGSPEAHANEHTGTERAQHDAIARKFYSKAPPPVSIAEYLARLQRYCPMSSAVWLSAGAYVHRLGVEQRSVPVTKRTVHRLVLASLRVAMKALEDLSYPHARFAGVGGVSERELAKLEISLCYLLEFRLVLDCARMREKAVAMQQVALAGRQLGGIQLRLPSMKEKRHGREVEVAASGS